MYAARFYDARFFNARYWGGAGAVAVEAPAVSDGKRRRGQRKYRSADDELSEVDVRYMQRKLRELRAAKDERERTARERELGEALAKAAKDDEAADLIAKTIVTAKPGKDIFKPAFNWREVGRDLVLIERVIVALGILSKELQTERKTIDDEEAAIVLLLN